MIIHEDNSVSITDDGRGIPVENHPEQQRPAVEVVLTTLHAGGKFEIKAIRYPEGFTGWGGSSKCSPSGWR